MSQGSNLTSGPQLRRAFPGALVGLALLASVCTPAPRDSRKAAQPVSLEQVPPSPKEDVPSALTDPNAQGLPAAIVDTSQIVAGGPPPDGIPSIDQPKFEKTSDVDWLEDREPVLVAGSGKAARAYPIQILTWHEIVNETIEGVPLAITYCPLCNSGIGFNRRIGTRVLEFGTSGKLYRSALVMYDRQTESLWSQFTGKAIAGVFVESELEYFPVSIASWSDGAVVTQTPGCSAGRRDSIVTTVVTPTLATMTLRQNPGCFGVSLTDDCLP
jgi:hypothetical protein